VEEYLQNCWRIATYHGGIGQIGSHLSTKPNPEAEQVASSRARS